MSKKQFWSLVILAAPTSLLIGFCVGAVFGMRFDSDRTMVLAEINRALQERREEKSHGNETRGSAQT